MFLNSTHVVPPASADHSNSANGQVQLRLVATWCFTFSVPQTCSTVLIKAAAGNTAQGIMYVYSANLSCCEVFGCLSWEVACLIDCTFLQGIQPLLLLLFTRSVAVEGHKVRTCGGKYSTLLEWITSVGIQCRSPTYTYQRSSIPLLSSQYPLWPCSQYTNYANST